MNGHSAGSRSQMYKGKVAVQTDFSGIDGVERSQSESTSGITALSTMENFTRWKNDVGSGGTPNAALAGKGQVDFNSKTQSMPPMAGG